MIGSGHTARCRVESVARRGAACCARATQNGQSKQPHDQNRRLPDSYPTTFNHSHCPTLLHEIKDTAQSQPSGEQEPAVQPGASLFSYKARMVNDKEKPAR